MPTLRLVVPSAPRVTLIDCVLGLWALSWILLAIAVAHNTREVANVGDTVSATFRPVGGSEWKSMGEFKFDPKDDAKIGLTAHHAPGRPRYRGSSSPRPGSR